MLGQAGGGDAGNGGPAGVHALGPGAFFQEDLDSGSGAGGDALGGDDGLGREIKQARGDDASAEMGNEPGGMKAVWWKPPLAAAPTRIAVSIPAA